jgi:DHA2 family multidrug resistance protein
MILFFALYGSIVLLPLFMQELLNFPAVTAGILEFAARHGDHGRDADRAIADQQALGDARTVLRRPVGCWNRRLYVLASEHESRSLEFLLAADGNGRGIVLHVRSPGNDHVDPIPQQEMGYATSVIALARNLGAGIGVSVFTALVARREPLHQARLAAAMATEHALPQRTLAALLAYLRASRRKFGIRRA